LSRILLVDDDPVVLQSLHERLTTLGYTNETAGGGDIALDLLKTQSFDLVITDFMMEPVDGLGVLIEVKKLYPNTFVIILTSYDDKEVVIDALRFDADDFLSKSCSSDELIFRINKCLDKAYNKKLETVLDEQIGKHYQTLSQISDVLELEIDQRQKTEDELLEAQRKLESRFQLRAEEIGELNLTLENILGNLEKRRSDVEERILLNLRETVFPYLEKLTSLVNDSTGSNLLEIIKANLNDLVSPFSRKLLLPKYQLTPSEIQVANLVKQGKSSKEISEVLNISKRTAETHRANLRKKMGLTNTAVNLETFLLSLKDKST
jgi:DNA-binding NarL/FixJ family response regulator